MSFFGVDWLFFVVFVVMFFLFCLVLVLSNLKFKRLMHNFLVLQEDQLKAKLLIEECKAVTDDVISRLKDEKEIRRINDKKLYDLVMKRG